jgi:hypothetical protein
MALIALAGPSQTSHARALISTLTLENAFMFLSSNDLTQISTACKNIPNHQIPPDPLKWMEADMEAKQRLLRDLSSNTHMSLPPFRLDKIRLQMAELPFYKPAGFRAYRLTDLRREKPNQYLFLAREGDVYLHDFTNQTIYDINEIAPGIRLDTLEHCMAYAKFFFYYVRGQLGSFIIAEIDENVPWLRQAKDHDKRAVRDLLQPLAYHGLKDDGRAYLSATVVFKNALFRTDIAIAPHAMTLFLRGEETDEVFQEEMTVGQMELLNEELLLENLPVAMEPHPMDYLTS